MRITKDKERRLETARKTVPTGATPRRSNTGLAQEASGGAGLRRRAGGSEVASLRRSQYGPRMVLKELAVRPSSPVTNAHARANPYSVVDGEFESVVCSNPFSLMSYTN